MSADSEQLPPPNNSGAFESLCLELWRDIWADQNAQKNGRNGQPQAGVDIYGQNAGKWAGVQCKQKDGLLWSKLTVVELQAEVDKALTFTPPLSSFVLATSGPADEEVQKCARELTGEHQSTGRFSVTVWSWREIWQELHRRRELLERLGPIYWPRLWTLSKDGGFRSLHQLPPPPVYFTGREEDLAALESRLTNPVARDGETAVGCYAIRGMGGVGKTALAVALAHRLKGHFPDAQLFVNLRGIDPEHRPPISPAEAMQSVIHCFHPNARLPNELDVLTPIYHSVLREGDRRMLIVLDNAADAEQIKPLLLRPNCLLLVTSRMRFTIPGSGVLDLESLASKESEDLLKKLARRLEGYLEETGKLCGYLPLAIEVFAGIVNTKTLFSVPDLLRRLRDRQERLPPVEAAFQVSFEMLPTDLGLRWCLLSIFPESFCERAAGVIWSTSKTDVCDSADAGREALQALVNVSLVQWNPTTGRFQLHDLARQFCAEKLPEVSSASARFLHAEHFCGVLREAQNLYLQGGDGIIEGLRLFDTERQNIETAQSWSATAFEAGDKTGRPTPIKESAARLCFAFADAGVHIVDMRLHPTHWMSWLDTAVLAARHLDDRKAEANHLGNLANAYAHLGDHSKTIELCQQILAITSQTRDVRLQAGALNTLGIAYLELGNKAVALQHFKAALLLTRELRDLKGEALILMNLGTIYRELHGGAAAIASTKKALELFRELGDRKGMADALGNLGLAHAASGDNRTAIELINESLRISEVLGDMRASGISFTNLGNIYQNMGDHMSALQFYQQALAVTRKLGDIHGEAKDLMNIGSAYFTAGKMREAVTLQQEALSIFQRVGDKLGSANAKVNLGNAYGGLGEFNKALTFHAAAAKDHQEIGNPAGQATSLFNLALALRELGRHPEAAAQMQAALRIYESLRSPDAIEARQCLTAWERASASKGS